MTAAGHAVGCSGACTPHVAVVAAVLPSSSECVHFQNEVRTYKKSVVHEWGNSGHATKL